MPTAADIKTFAEEFQSLDDAKVELYISKAMLSVPPNVWRDKTEFGIILLTCHLLTLARIAASAANTGTAGPVTSEKVGDLQRSYGAMASVSSGAGGSLGQTTYGAEFFRLRRGLVRGPVVVG